MEFGKEIILENISKTMEIENQILNKTDLSLVSDFLENKITIEEALENIKSEYM